MGQRKITIVWTGDEKLRLRFTIPAGWDELRAWKLAELLLERLEGQPRAVDDVTMSRRGGAPLPPDALISTLAEGECVRVAPRPTVTQAKEEAPPVAAPCLAKVETRVPMAGVAIECDLVNEKAPDISLTVVDELSKQRHAFTYKADQPVRDVKRDLRDAEAPRYRFEAHMGSLFLEVDGASKLLDDFGSLSEQGVVSGSTLRHVVVLPTKLQRTAVDTCPGPYPSY
ncbi:unnamed protein product [Pelagomonas calceolata]|uniref:Uncharacterized protein n=2 Tax=Pelagomonas calceolata TaxID=35677 RepID=A0A8J2SDV8_9STRA|nr:unnamed protein product [Pelagomonas calceolata]